ncbi:SBBP repeat-containing protein [Hymenobacter sp. 5516J-16]|uniref:SBBP repeat-containing protein n=1 Tax=Hymenobacter sp. 5516J-16 TaxID=2932253 RepID=UPI001FD3EFB2|nr:SBBP repeat-containing protein [Hymenobacter sp. 5516J-16]UOQ76893.1 SBBP repeat-containing protein [Hymenobacter sp. 5516J-16]
MLLPLRSVYVFFLGALLLLSGPGQAQIPAFTWATGGEKPTSFGQQVQAHGIATDRAGNTVVVGSFRQTLTLGSTTLTAAGDYDIFVALLDAAGTYQWAVRAGGRDEDMATGVALDAAGNIYLTGNTKSYESNFGALQVQNPSYGIHLFVAKLSPTGQWLRVNHTSGKNTNNFIFGTALAVDGAGNAYVTGGLRVHDAMFGSLSVHNEGLYNAFVAKLNAAGTWEWAVTEGGTGGYDFGQGIGLDASGNVYVTGTFEGNEARFGSQILRRGNWRSSLFAAKLNSQGQWQWATAGGGAAQTRGNGLAVEPDGTVYLAGMVAGKQASVGSTSLPKDDTNPDLLVAKLNPNGAWQWAVRGGGPETDTGNGIALDAAGNVLVTGSFSGTQVAFGQLPLLSAAGKTDVVVAQLTSQGAWRWASGGGGSGTDLGLAVASSATGTVQVAGTFQGPDLTLGSTTLFGGATYYEYFADRFFVTTMLDLALPAPSELTLWPNPSRGTVWATGLEANQPVQVFDATGRLVAANARPAYEVEGLYLPTLKPGIYLVRCGKQTRRLTIE